MRRREFITLLGGATLGWSHAARAEQPQRMPRIGILSSLAESDPEAQAWHAAFRKRLEELGWMVGRNVGIDHRWAAGDHDRIRELAKELVELQPDVILGYSTPVIAGLLQETRTIPIVFVVISDPVGSGFVASLPRPGGNVTGFSNFEASMGGKWLELLKEIAPGVTRVAIMFNPETAPYVAGYYERPFEAAAPVYSVAPISAPVRSDTEIENATAALGREPGGGLIVMPDFFASLHRELIVALASRHRLPAIYPYRYFAASGGLISYGIDVDDLYRRAASYVDRIIKGDKPADLPVQAPRKFQLVINLKTAKAFGLRVPLTLQASADEVIE